MVAALVLEASLYWWEFESLLAHQNNAAMVER